jgi:hypothetical protein
MIIALSGRRVDGTGAQIRRFPVENIELVQKRLRELFDETEPIRFSWQQYLFKNAPTTCS